MNLFILRHGDAENEAPTDQERVLSQTGKLKIAKIVLDHATLLQSVDYICISPFIRTQQTYNELLKSLPNCKEIKTVTTNKLVPSASVDDVISILESLNETDNTQSVLLISHQPLVGMLIDSLCNLETGCYRMGTAALAHIQLDIIARGCGDLTFLRHPEL